jgi:hypothetical protein
MEGSRAPCGNGIKIEAHKQKRRAPHSEALGVRT